MPTKKQRLEVANKHDTTRGRRKALTSALLGAGAATASLYLGPQRWTRPIIESVILPAHARTSQIELAAGGWFGGSTSMVMFRDVPLSGRNVVGRISEFLVAPAIAGETAVVPCLPFLICIDRTGSGNEIQVRVGFDDGAGGVVVDTQTFTPNPDLTFNRNFSDSGAVNLAVAGEYAPGGDQWFGTVQGTCGKNVEDVYNGDHDNDVFIGDGIQVASASDTLQLALVEIPTVNDEWTANQTDCSFDH